MIQTINGLSIDKRIVVYAHSGMSISHIKHGYLMHVIIRMNFVNIMVGERSQSPNYIWYNSIHMKGPKQRFYID